MALAVVATLVLASSAAAADPTVAAAGDIACSPEDPFFNGGAGGADNCGQQRTSNLISGVDAVLALGDNQYNAGSLSDFRASYDPSWGRFEAITHPVPGNHEYGTPGAAGYFDYFGAQAGTRGEGWYSFDLGAWHVLAINSECDELGNACAAGGAQEAWVRADLAAHPTACTLAFWHEPRFASGSAPIENASAMGPIWSALYDAGVDLALVAHKHFYERLSPLDVAGNVDAARGIRQLVVGTGGEDRAGNPAPITGSEVRNNTTFGVVRLDLHPTSFDWRFLPEPGKTFSDSGSQQCHGPNVAPPPAPPGSPPPAAGSPVPAPSPGTAARRRAARLAVTSWTFAGSRVVLRGRLLRGASTRHLQVTIRRPDGRRVRVKVRFSGGRSGRWRAVVTLPRSVRRVKVLRVAVRYLGERTVAPKTVRLRARRGQIKVR